MKSITDILMDGDGNAFTIMGRVKKALKTVKRNDLLDEYMEKAMSSDYDNLIQVSIQFLEKAGFND